MKAFIEWWKNHLPYISFHDEIYDCDVCGDHVCEVCSDEETENE